MLSGKGNATIWVPEAKWDYIRPKADLLGSVMLNHEGQLLYKATIDPSVIGGLAQINPTVRISALSCQIGNQKIDALVAELTPHARYKRTVCMSTYKPSPEEAKSFLTPTVISKQPLLAKLCFATEVPASQSRGIDGFVASAYQNWPFMMLHQHLEPIFYATSRSLNHFGQKGQ